MLDLFAKAVLVLVCLLLGWTLLRQFVVSSAAAMVLDHLAIVPQWKFFAQTRIDGNSEAFDDFHLLARTAPGDGKSGDWVELLHYGERPWWHAVWNPRRYSRSLIVQHAVMLTLAEEEPEHAARSTALSYLTVLRFTLDRTMPHAGAAVQFAIATTDGRVGREPKVRFVSAWHCP
ncbi:MAG: hypothetical protein ACKOPM_12295 [Novosphingobium sp.]